MNSENIFNTKTCTQFCGSLSENKSVSVTAEDFCVIYINAREVLSSSVSPSMKKEFALGYLLSEGIISAPDEIDSVMEEDSKISVMTKTPRKLMISKKILMTGCGGSSAALNYSRIPQAPEGAKIKADVILNASCGFEARNEEIYGAAVFDASGTCISNAYDMGRINALFKSLGGAFVNNAAFPETFAVTDGRITSDAVSACLFAQIPVLVSTAGVSDAAVSAAKEKKLTLVGNAGRGSMDIFSGKERILF